METVGPKRVGKKEALNDSQGRRREEKEEKRKRARAIDRDGQRRKGKRRRGEKGRKKLHGEFHRCGRTWWIGGSGIAAAADVVIDDSASL